MEETRETRDGGIFVKYILFHPVPPFWVGLKSNKTVPLTWSKFYVVLVLCQMLFERTLLCFVLVVTMISKTNSLILRNGYLEVTKTEDSYCYGNTKKWFYVILYVNFILKPVRWIQMKRFYFKFCK